MAPIGRIYVDANVFIRLFENSDELSKALGDLLLLPASEAPRFATSELTLAEVLVLPYRNSQDSLIDLYDGWTTNSDYVEVGPIDRSVLWYAAVLRAEYHHLKLPDAIHVSTAIGMGCSHILTGDERLRDRYELTHKRYGIERGPAVVEVIRPDLGTVTSLVATLAE